MLRAFLLEIKGRWGGGPGRHLWVAVICKKCVLMIHDLTANSWRKGAKFPKRYQMPRVASGANMPLLETRDYPKIS